MVCLTSIPFRFESSSFAYDRPFFLGWDTTTSVASAEPQYWTTRHRSPEAESPPTGFVTTSSRNTAQPDTFEHLWRIASLLSFANLDFKKVICCVDRRFFGGLLDHQNPGLPFFLECSLLFFMVASNGALHVCQLQILCLTISCDFEFDCTRHTPRRSMGNLGTSW